MNENIVKFIRQVYKTEEFIPLHAPVFLGNEKRYLNECIDSTFVSYVGNYVTEFENQVASYTGVKHAVAMANGTLALHIALLLSGVKANEEVLTQALTFVATINAINYCGASPIFLDSDLDTLGLAVSDLEEFLENETEQGADGFCYNRKTKRRIAACLPVHIFGHPCHIDKLHQLCLARRIPLIEDAAESIGSRRGGVHTGNFGEAAIVSFNGNKTITTGGGGMLLTNDEQLAKRAKHISTTAKQPHPWNFFHDEVGYNYRLTNLNAAVGCAQMESLSAILANKRETAALYDDYFRENGIKMFKEPANCESNYWLNAIVFSNMKERDSFLEYANAQGVMARPVWTLNHKLLMYSHCQKTALTNAQYWEERLVNIPSSVRLK
ncbi:MAG: LegC family aminotransferase [Deltaproteobacteria bacterium]|nr:LegC family aminotransferase [Deltaproteobacteria bacterium]